MFDLAGDAGSTPEALYGLRVTANLFPTLGVSPMLGRNILPEEEKPGNNEMILSYGVWARRFNSDRSVVGRTVTVNGHACLIIGVMPPGFNFPLRRSAVHTPSPYVEFWTALYIKPGSKPGGVGAVARLRRGCTIAQARQDVAAIGVALSHEFPATNRDKTLTVNFLRDRAVGGAANGLLLLMAAGLLFMLIGCANVANLLLARGIARQREISVKLALGAGRARIARQLLTESCVLAVLGGLGGYALTAAAWKILPSVAPVNIPRLAAARADGTVFGFALALAMINGIVFGIAPALRLARMKETISLGGFGSRGAAVQRQHGTRSALVAAEAAISVILVVIGGQLLGSFLKLVNTAPGFEADHVLASIVLPAPERYPKPEQRALLFQRILDSVRALPGVESAGTVDALPFSGENHGGFVSASAVSGDSKAPLTAEVDIAGGEYLQTMGVHLLEGRWFQAEDMSQSSDAAIVNDFAARRLWPGLSALGQRICLYCTPEQPNNWKRVIGVVSSANHAALTEPMMANVYLAAGAMQSSVFLVVRTERPMGDLQKAIRRTVAAIDPNQPVFLSVPMRTLLADSVADRRFIVTLLSITACLALLLCAAGVYGVISYTTARRTQEFGIRLALGATPRELIALVFRQGFATVAVGVTLGLCVLAPLLYVLKSFLTDLESRNLTYAGLSVVLVAVTAAIACWVPARRATKIEPMAALRQE